MCLRVNKRFESKDEALKYFKKPLIAKEDIKVYKVLETHPNLYCSPYRGFKFEKGFQYTESKFTKFISGDKLFIKQGLHAFTSKKRAETMVNYHNYGSPIIIKEMWISKGSKYFLGIDGDIVTDNLIWY